MVDYQAILIWFGGVFTNSILNLTLNTISNSLKKTVDIRERIWMRDLSDKLILGKITSSDYIQNLIEEELIESNQKDFEKNLLNQVNIYQLVVEIIQLIDNYEMWLICDYPRSWMNELKILETLSDQISTKRTIFPAELFAANFYPELIDSIINIIGHPKDKLLIIDSDPARAVNNIRHRIGSINYVYPERLQHELALQGVLKTNVEVLHPTSSKRIIAT